MYYFDTSAAVKLVLAETNSRALKLFAETHAGSGRVSSALIRIELVRTLRRAGQPARVSTRLLDTISLVPINEWVVDAAADEPSLLLRSLDAIHLATARMFGAELDGLLTYDERLARAARDAGISVVSPRD